jgi:hypothetical protein
VRVLERTRASREEAGRAAPPPARPGTNPGLAAGLGLLALAGVTALALRPGARPGPAPEDPGPTPDATALGSRLDELADPGLDPEQRHSLLRLLASKVPAGAEPLRLLAVRRLEEIRAATPPEPETEFHYDLALAALGEVRGYTGALRHAAGAMGSRPIRLAAEALANGLARGGLPGEEQAEELAAQLWRLDRGGEVEPEEQRQFFRAVAALGTDLSVARLEDLLRESERAGHSAARQAAAMGALQQLAGSGRPGAEAAQSLLVAGIQGKGKVALGDDDALQAARRMVGAMGSPTRGGDSP